MISKGECLSKIKTNGSVKLTMLHQAITRMIIIIWIWNMENFGIRSYGSFSIYSFPLSRVAA